MKHIKSVLLGSLTLVLLTGCGSIKKSEIKSSSLDVPSLPNDFKNQYLSTINNARSTDQNCGTYGNFSAAPLLKWNNKLYGAAYEHSNDMATSNTFSHEGSGQKSDRVGTSNNGKSSARDRVNAYGYSWRIYAENIGAGTDIDTVEKSVNQLLASDGHCANIMNPLLSEVGIAMAKNSNSRYRYYWTQVFGTPPS